MSGYNKFFEVNGVELKKDVQKWCTEHKTTVADLSRKAGFADSYFSNAFAKGQLNRPSAYFLKAELGIDVNDYMPNKVLKKAEEPTPQVVSDSELLAKIDEVNANIKELANIQLRLLALMEKRTLRPIARGKEDE